MMPSTSAKQAKFMRAVAHSPKFAKKVGVSQSVGKDFEMADKRKKTKKFGDGGATMESKRKPIDLRRSILGSDKDIVERGNRDPYEKMPKTGPKEMPYRRPKLKKAGEMGYKKGGEVMKKSDKAGRALVKKSADTEGRAMVKKMAMGGNLSGGPVAGTPTQTGSGATGNLVTPNRAMGSNLSGGPVAGTPTQTGSGATGNLVTPNRAMGSNLSGGPVAGTPTQTGSGATGNLVTPNRAESAFRAMAGRGQIMRAKGGKVVKKAAGGLASGHKSANGIAKKGLTKGKEVKMNKGGACYAKGGSVRGIDGIAKKGHTRCKGAR